jgi:uncharacterized protein YcbX
MSSIEIGRIAHLYCYPVKSMAGVPLETARLGWHGIAGDRRFAFRRTGDQSGFPWLSASRLPELLLYKPCIQTTSNGPGVDHTVTHIRTPGGLELPLRSSELSDELSNKHGSALQLMQLNHGMFDEAPISIINTVTVRDIEREADRAIDLRNFRMNIVLASDAGGPFAEDGWLGKNLTFGVPDSGPIVGVTMRDKRCVMVNLDPDTAAADPQVMKAAVRLNDNNAGVYGTIIREGDLEIGQPVFLS